MDYKYKYCNFKSIFQLSKLNQSYRLAYNVRYTQLEIRNIETLFLFISQSYLSQVYNTYVYNLNIKY